MLQTPKPKLRRRSRPWQRKASVMAAIPGCRGILSELAGALECGLNTLYRALHQPGWEYVLEAFQDERLISAGRVERRVWDIALYSAHDNIALQACNTILPVVNPEFAPSSRVVVEGGRKPIQHQHQHQVVVFQIPAEIMSRSLEDRLAVLEQVEARETELNDRRG